MTHNFKVGDRVRMLSGNYSGRLGTVRQIDLGDKDQPCRIQLDGADEVPLWYLSDEKFDLVSDKKEPAKMKIADYEVEILSNDSCKVGCQQVSKADVERVLAAMDRFDGGEIKPSNMNVFQIGLVISGPHKGQLLIRTYSKNLSGGDIFSNIGKDGATGWASATSNHYDENDTRVRLCHWDGERLTVPAAEPTSVQLSFSRVDIADKDNAYVMSRAVRVTRSELTSILTAMREWRPVAPQLEVGNFVRISKVKNPERKFLIGKHGRLIGKWPNGSWQVEISERLPIDEFCFDGHILGCGADQLERVE